MEYTQKEMSLEDAMLIANWSYPEPYEIYNLGISKENIAELLGGEYSAVYLDGELFGFFCTGESARIPIEPAASIYKSESAVDIGLGISPCMTGRGLGRGFLSFAIECIKQNRPNAALRLTVADFNERAIKAYKALGFEKTAQFIRPSDGMQFSIMLLKSITAGK